MSNSGLKVCLVTSYRAADEPRAPRHAATLAQLEDVREVVFIDCAPRGQESPPVKALAGSTKIRWHTHPYDTRVGNPGWLALQRAWQQVQRLKFRCGGPLSTIAFSTRVWGLERVLLREQADVYIAHNPDTLLAAFRVSLRRKALVMFDSMEFHSDMGDAQTPLEQAMVHRLEKSCLPGCALVLASSGQVADALAAEYGIPRPFIWENVPPRQTELPPQSEGCRLYWRNSVVALGQRGLDDALQALARLPDDVALYLQGRMANDGGSALRGRIAELKLAERVHIEPAYAPDAAVTEAAQHHIGLCLERKGCRNHDLTTSNKIFDYHMAGLAVVASDLPGLSAVLQRSSGGVTFKPGDVEDLTGKILSLYRDPVARQRYARAARDFALREGNCEAQAKSFQQAFTEALRAKSTN